MDTRFGMTRWWKCDLQVATPAWQFTFPVGSNYDLTTTAGRIAFADAYMASLKTKGIHVIAIADHNTGEWIDEMKAAGDRNGVTVFPGCEITTGAGADGIHIVVIGDRRKTSHDFDLLLAVLGFDNADYPRFHLQDNGSRVPGSSNKTLAQVLDLLPDDYLVLAPHALTQNGIASANTVKGDIRWRALHHTRLACVDPGDCSNPTQDSFNDRFRRRELADFPRLQDLAFISTSDAYSFQDLGRRFCWVRMSTPSLEGLRQAFLDWPSRIICDWDGRLKDYPNADPNNVQHGWIEELELGAGLGNSALPIKVGFHAGLNVLIGGRGSGKSTIVAAVRQLYSSIASLPETVRAEAEEFSRKVFTSAAISSKHRLPVSQEVQDASWTEENGKGTLRQDGTTFPTAFRVRVVNQKELFERVAATSGTPYSASRSLLSLIDESLGLVRSESAPSGTWARELREAQNSWIEAAKRKLQLEADIAALASTRARVKEIESQLSAFASPEIKTQLDIHRKRQQEREFLQSQSRELLGWLTKVEFPISLQPIVAERLPPVIDATFQGEIAQFLAALKGIEISTRGALAEQIRHAREKVVRWQADTQSGPWHKSVEESEGHFRAHTQELATRGFSSSSIAQLERELTEKQRLATQLEQRAGELSEADGKMAAAWIELLQTIQDRRIKRQELLSAVTARSGSLRFEILEGADIASWVSQIRSLMNVRVDGFIEDIPHLGNGIWGQEPGRDQRWNAWTRALMTGDFQGFQQTTRGVRGSWFERLSETDLDIRLRLAVEIPEDVVVMRFLKERGNAANQSDWQVITEGSPGQRTAAMLGLVLHFGDEPLILDQPEDDLDTEWITELLVKELRRSRWNRQLIVVSHNANIPVLGDAERVISLENRNGAIRVRSTQHDGPPTTEVPHTGPIEEMLVRSDIQNIMEGGVVAFMKRERKYNNEVRAERVKQGVT
jgi:energy-coupling factor transporter ATP-binding protein EcfA2